MQSLLQIFPDRQKYIKLTHNTGYAFQLMLLPTPLPVSKCLNKLTNADINWYNKAKQHFFKALQIGINKMQHEFVRLEWLGTINTGF